MHGQSHYTRVCVVAPWPSLQETVPPDPEAFLVNKPQDMDVDEDKTIPQRLRDFCRERGADVPARNDAKRDGWCDTYKKGPKQRQQLPKLYTLILNFPDPTLLTSEVLYGECFMV